MPKAYQKTAWRGLMRWVRASPTGSNRARGKANRCAKRQLVIVTTQLNEVMIAVDFYLFETPCMSDTDFAQ